jgi:hypothetical protein
MFKTFSSLPVGTKFRIPGYDNLFEKVDEKRSKNHGCGLLRKPIKLKGKWQEFEAIELVETL